MARTLDTMTKAGTEPLYDFIEFTDFHANKTGRLRYRVNFSKATQQQVDALQTEGQALQEILTAPTKEQVTEARKKIKDAALSDEQRTALQAILDMPRTADQITEDERADARAREATYTDDVLRVTAGLVMADDTAGAETLTLDEWKQFAAESDPVFVGWLTGKLWDKVKEYRNGERFLSKR